MIKVPNGYEFLEKYNHKTMIPIISVKGISENARKGLLAAMDYVVADCNLRQEDIDIDWYHFEDTDTGMEIFGLLIPDDCGFDEDVIRSFIYTNAFSIMGSFITPLRIESKN